MSDLAKVGRIAYRHEGEFWNAYHAMPGTMEGAHLLGSIRMRLVERQDRKQAFMDLMRECYADLIEHYLGVRPSFPDGPQAAPESERAGHG